MAKINGIPVYEALLDGEDTGMFKISLVDEPAVMSDFVKLANMKAPAKYSVADEEKRLVRGVVMRADFPIYRNDPRFGEYYIIYKACTIREMAEKYMTESRQNNVNLMHEDGTDTDGVKMVQWFIKDTAAGVAPEGFGDIADGSLFAEFHVQDDAIWEDVKAGTYKGFSLEGVFELAPTEMKRHNNLKYENIMSKVSRFKAALAKALMELGAVTTDKGVLSWDGDEDLKAGDSVYTEDSEGNRVAAADGDYRTEDGKIIRVAEGRVSEITDDEAEVSGQGEEGGKVTAETNAERMRRVAEAFSLSYDERYRRISEAVSKTGLLGECFYVAEAADDYAVCCTWDEDWNDKFFRFSLTWNGNDVSVSSPVEVKQSFVPLDYVPEFKGAAEMRSELERLRSELDELKKQPAAQPAHTVSMSGGTARKTGNKGLDRLAEMLGE